MSELQRVPEKPHILLVKPTVKYPIVREDCDIPLGLVSIISYLRAQIPEQAKVELHDERLEKLTGKNPEDLDYLESGDVVGVTACSNEFPRALKILEKAHERGKITVMGGVFPSGNPAYIMRNYPCVDFVVVGEGEIAFSKLLQALKKHDQTAFEKIEGLWYRCGGRVINGGVAERLTEIPRVIDVYQQQIVSPEKYFRHVQGESHRGRIIPTMVSRGCPGTCVMCSLSS